MLTESPEIRVDTLAEAQSTGPGSKAAYVAALLKGTLAQWPEAVLRLSGGDFIGTEFAKRLLALGIPPRKIERLSINSSQVLRNVTPGLANPFSLRVNGIGVAIVYRPGFKRKVSMQFKPDTGEPPVDVQFEVSPTGTEIEVGAEIAILKNYIKRFAGASSSDASGRDRIRTIKIATKVAGLAQFDMEMQNRVAATLKLKVKEALTFQVAKPVAIEFYGAGFAKYDLEKNKPKIGTEFGVGVTFSFD